MLSYAVLVTTMLAMQTTPPPPAVASKEKPQTMTLSGCVTRDAATPGAFNFSDGSSGAKYRVSGVSVRKYTGQRVEIVGQTVERRLSIRGGLTPSANAAAQAGALDPAQAAIASMPESNSGTGSAELPAFKVTRVRAVEGSCK